MPSWLWVLIACGGGPEGADSAAPSTSAPPPTWAGVEALFVEHCDQCHPATTGLDLHDAVAEDVRDGSGRYVVAGDPDASLLWDAVGGSSLTNMMPPSGRLSPAEVDHVEAWITAGAPLE